LLDANLEQLHARLLATADGDPREILDALDIDLEEVANAEQARTVIVGLPPTIGLDLETCGQSQYLPPRRPLVITKAGTVHAHQPKTKHHRHGLDPIRGRIRIVSVFDPHAAKAWLFDLDYVPLEALAGLWPRRLVLWNASFDLAFLEAAGISPSWINGMQLAGLLYGCRRGTKTKPGSRAIESTAQQALGVTVDKSMQTSDWSAPYLTDRQKIYAGADSALSYKVTAALWHLFDTSARPAFWLQSNSARATARMRLKGLPFNAETHRATIARWEAERDQAHAAFVEATGAEPPGHPRALAAWLEERLDPILLATLERTPTGLLSTKADALERLAYRPEIRPLMRLRWAAHGLNAFGKSLLEAVHPVTGRIHADFIHCAARPAGCAAGNRTCSSSRRTADRRWRRHLAHSWCGRTCHRSKQGSKLSWRRMKSCARCSPMAAACTASPQRPRMVSWRTRSPAKAIHAGMPPSRSCTACSTAPARQGSLLPHSRSTASR
jgi:hypothetical protein